MDPIGATTAAITLTVTIISYVKVMKSAKKDYKDWMNQLHDVQDYLMQLQDRLERAKPDKDAPWFQNFIKAMGLDITGVNGAVDLSSLKVSSDSPFGRLKNKLEELEKKVKIKPEWYHKTFRIALHPFNKTDVEETFTEIGKLQTKFTHTLQLENLQVAEATHGLVLEVKDSLVSQQHEHDARDALSQLSTLNFADRQNQIYATCFQDETPPAQWFLTSEEFVAWREGRPWPLYCHGKPGAGKVNTIIASRRAR